MSRLLQIFLFFTLLASVVSCGKNNGKDTDTQKQGSVTNITETASKASIQETGENLSNSPRHSIKVKNIGKLAEVFNDSNHIQFKAAERLGIDPITDISSSYFLKRPIVKITDNEYYKIDNLSYSLPFLVPEAAELLNDIGRLFIDSLKARGGDSHKIKVTSLLRTPATVSKLKKVNVNAADSSTHQYGTTFDISYVNFYCNDTTRSINQGDLKNLLAEVLLDLRKQNRCYVKFEVKTGCFHITATK